MTNLALTLLALNITVAASAEAEQEDAIAPVVIEIIEFSPHKPGGGAAPGIILGGRAEDPAEVARILDALMREPGKPGGG